MAGTQKASDGAVCIFERGGEFFGAPILDVQEALPLGDFTVVPKVPSHVLGMTNLRGEALPIVVLDRFVGLQEIGTEEAANLRSGQVLVLRIGDTLMGVLVDSVLAVTQVPGEGLHQPASAGRSNCRGVFRFGDRLVSVLDTSALMKEIGESLAESSCFSRASAV